MPLKLTPSQNTQNIVLPVCEVERGATLGSPLSPPHQTTLLPPSLVGKSPRGSQVVANICTYIARSVGDATKALSIVITEAGSSQHSATNHLPKIYLANINRLQEFQ